MLSYFTVWVLDDIVITQEIGGHVIRLLKWFPVLFKYLNYLTLKGGSYSRYVKGSNVNTTFLLLYWLFAIGLKSSRDRHFTWIE